MRKLFAALLLSLFSLGPQPAKTPQQAPRNPRYVEFVRKNEIRRLFSLKADVGGGLIPEKFDTSHIFNEKTLNDKHPGVDYGLPSSYIVPHERGPYEAFLESMASADPAPAAYDARDTNYVSPIKDQGVCPVCWIFAALASLESQLIMNGFPYWTLSEENIKECHVFTTRGCYGGSFLWAMSYLTLQGVHLDDGGSQGGEAFVAVDDSPCNRDSPYRQKIIVTGFQAVSNATISGIQDNIYAYGPLKCDLYANANYQAYSSGCINDDAAAPTQHSNLIIGWDDNDTDCNGTGGFIIKNQYGTDWGEAGYWRATYTDTTDGDPALDCTTGLWRITGFKYADPEETIYAYDEGGWQDLYGYGDSDAYGLVKFIADRDIIIEAIDFYSPNGGTINYTVSLYDGFNGSDLGNLLTTQSSTVAKAGYYSIPLSSPKSFKSGDQIVAVLYLNVGAGYTYPIVVDDTDTAYCNIESGKTYLSNSGTSWTDASTLGTPSDVALRVRGRYRGTKHGRAVSTGKVIKK